MGGFSGQRLLFVLLPLWISLSSTQQKGLGRQMCGEQRCRASGLSSSLPTAPYLHVRRHRGTRGFSFILGALPSVTSDRRGVFGAGKKIFTA